jgi:hypothetical protein
MYVYMILTLFLQELAVVIMHKPTAFLLKLISQFVTHFLIPYI